MTNRRRILARERASVFSDHGGVCDICGGKIHVGEIWEISHRIPLAAGGADDKSNWFPVHRKCHRTHTATVDAPLIAKVRRVGQKHIGAKQSTGSFPSRRFAAPAPKDRSTTKIAPRKPLYEDA